MTKNELKALAAKFGASAHYSGKHRIMFVRGNTEATRAFKKHWIQNELQVIGHLGHDCRVNQVNGKDVINFSVAHSESYKDKEGVKHEKTTWVDCSYWPNSPAIAAYLKKGTQVYVEGTPEVRTFEKRDGGIGASMSCRVYSVQLLGSANKSNGNGSDKQAAADAPENSGGYKPVETSQAEQGGAPAGTNDDLPF